MLDRIVDRVLQTVAWPAPEARAEPTDRVALERLWAAIRAGRRRPRGLKGLVRAVGAHIDRAVQARDRTALAPL